VSKASRRRALLGEDGHGDPLNDLPARLAREQEVHVMETSVNILQVLIGEKFQLTDDLARALCTVAGSILLLRGGAQGSLVSVAYNCKQYSEALHELLQAKRRAQ
jgi:hypothetical protein